MVDGQNSCIAAFPAVRYTLELSSVQSKSVQAWVEFLWQSWWGKNALADGFHVKIDRFNVDTS